MIQVPTTADFPDYVETVALDGVLYRLRFLYNTRNDAWYLTVLSADGTAIVQGLKLRLAWPVLRRAQFKRALPGGRMLCIDVGNTKMEPGRDDLAGRVELVYVPRSEIA